MIHIGIIERGTLQVDDTIQMAIDQVGSEYTNYNAQGSFLKLA